VTQQQPESFPRRLDPERLGDHLDRLYRAAWALCGSREEAEDLVQDTYIRVLARPRFLRREEDLAYLLRALRNTFLAGRRSLRARSVHVPLEEEGERASGVGPADALEQRRVYGAIADLQADFRDALVAVDVAGLSYVEAAQALRVPEGTLTSRLARARAQVADALSE
jgi:RNA polymerase sigma-70 factor (ECF subfamily)